MKIETVIHWLLVIIFIVVAAIALIMSWYSMMDLATATYGLPTWLSAMLSGAFDGGAIFLGLITITAALKGEAAFAAKVFTYLFIVGSIYINVNHAVIGGFGLVGMVMFGAAPVILAIVFEVFTKYLLRDKLRNAGLLNSRLPNAGMLAWIVEPKASAMLFKLGIQHRIRTAAGHLDGNTDNNMTALMDTLDNTAGQQPALPTSAVQQLDSKPALLPTQTALPATSDSMPTQAEFARQLLAANPAIETSHATASWAALGNTKATYKSFQTALGRERKKVTA